MRILLSDLCLQTGTVQKQLIYVCLCGTVQTQRGQIVGLRSRQIKPIQSQRESQKSIGQVGLDGIAQ